MLYDVGNDNDCEKEYDDDPSKEGVLVAKDNNNNNNNSNPEINNTNKNINNAGDNRFEEGMVRDINSHSKEGVRKIAVRSDHSIDPSISK